MSRCAGRFHYARKRIHTSADGASCYPELTTCDAIFCPLHTEILRASEMSWHVGRFHYARSVGRQEAAVLSTDALWRRLSLVPRAVVSRRQFDDKTGIDCSFPSRFGGRPKWRSYLQG